MQRSIARLQCEVCGRPYNPGERIKAIRIDVDTVVVHVDCMESKAYALLTNTSPSADRSAVDMGIAEAIIDRVDWS
jgi:hypothetical protein